MSSYCIVLGQACLEFYFGCRYRAGKAQNFEYDSSFMLTIKIQANSHFQTKERSQNFYTTNAAKNNEAARLRFRVNVMTWLAETRKHHQKFRIQGPENKTSIDCAVSEADRSQSHVSRLASYQDSDPHTTIKGKMFNSQQMHIYHMEEISLSI